MSASNGVWNASSSAGSGVQSVTGFPQAGQWISIGSRSGRGILRNEVTLEAAYQPYGLPPNIPGPPPSPLPTANIPRPLDDPQSSFLCQHDCQHRMSGAVAFCRFVAQIDDNPEQRKTRQISRIKARLLSMNAGCGGDLNPRPLGYEPLGSRDRANVYGLCQPTLPAVFVESVLVAHGMSLVARATIADIIRPAKSGR
jgi:hypothetical protein